MTATMTVPPIEQVAPNVVTRVKDGDLNLAKFGLLGVGVVLVGATCSQLGGEHKERAAFAYLTAYMGVLGPCLCALLFVMIQHITRSGWSVGVRRLSENLAGAIPVMALLFIPIWMNMHTLYHHWMEADATDKVLAGKSAWLNESFFKIRAVIYFVIWIGLATFFRGASLKQDQTGDPALSLRMARVAAPGILLFALSLTFAAFDWIMSLDPHWFSTIFGLTFFAGGYMAFFAFTILMSQWLGKKGYLREVINTEHYHDLAKLLFTFVVFWTYTNFSQYMLISYANLPEETAFFSHRQHGGWGAVGTLIIFGHFFIPFAFLMSRHIKRNPITRAIGASFLLVIHWIDMNYLILPNAGGHAAEGAHGAEHTAEAATDAGHPLFGHFTHGVGEWMGGLQWYDFTAYIGMFCLVAGTVLFHVCRHNLVPVRDPRLTETLNFQNI